MTSRDANIMEAGQEGSARQGEVPIGVVEGPRVATPRSSVVAVSFIGFGKMARVPTQNAVSVFPVQSKVVNTKDATYHFRRAVPGATWQVSAA